jgi:hypothetical protein
MWKAFLRYRALDPQSRRLFRQAAVLLPRVALSLRLRGFKKTRDTLQEKLTSSPADRSVQSDSLSDTVQKTCRMIKAGGHYGFVHPTCLVESLSLWYLLQKQNIPAQLRIGVRKLSDKFEAHAWVEHEGVALNQPNEPHQHYAAFDSAFSDLPGDKS